MADGTSFLMQEAVSVGEAASSYTAMLDKSVFFQRQIEECREVLRHAVNDEDRAFGKRPLRVGKSQLRQIKPVHLRHAALAEREFSFSATSEINLVSWLNYATSANNLESARRSHGKFSSLAFLH